MNSHKAFQRILNTFLLFSSFLPFFNKCIFVGEAYFMEGVRFAVRTITPDTFESEVVDSEEAWILAIKGTIVPEKEWQSEENQLRGVVNVAFVDLMEDEDFWLDKGYIRLHDLPRSVAITFPYGGERIKKKKFELARSVKEAKHIALGSLLETKLTWLRSKIEVERFVQAAYTSWPPRFPVVLTTERRITPPLYRALSLKYSRYYNFGILHSSLAEKAMGLSKMVKTPRLDILISTLTQNKTFKMATLTYETEKYGPMQYRYLTRFLFSAHEKHWPDLPNSKKYNDELGYEEDYKDDLNKIFANPVSEKEESQRKPIEEIKYENHRTMFDDSAPGFWVVAFLNGESKLLKNQIDVLSKVHQETEFQEYVLRFMWINSSCYPEYGSNFGVNLDSLPDLLLAKPQRRKFAKFTGKFQKDFIIKFIQRAIGGTLVFGPYSRFDNIEKRNCSKQSKENYVELEMNSSDEEKNSRRDDTEKMRGHKSQRNHDDL